MTKPAYPNCLYCGTPLFETATNGRPHKYCCAAHRMAWQADLLRNAKAHYLAMVTSNNPDVRLIERPSPNSPFIPKGWDASTMRHQGRQATKEEIAAAQAPRVGGVAAKAPIGAIFEGCNPADMPAGVSSRRSHKRKA